MSIRLGNQRVGFCEKPIPVLRIGHLHGAGYQIRSSQAQRNTSALIQ